MDSTDVLSGVSSDLRTELSRLGSSKSLYAATEGEMEGDTVLATVAAETGKVASLLREWSESDDAPDTFSSAADRIAEQHDELRSALSDSEGDTRQPMPNAMGEYTEIEHRLGALLGWTLVAERTASQASGFFTGQADPGTASTFRTFGDQYESLRTDTMTALDEHCTDEDTYGRALDAASAVVQAAYDEYVETLESLGVNPKPVC